VSNPISPPFKAGVSKNKKWALARRKNIYSVWTEARSFLLGKSQTSEVLKTSEVSEF
jgi:hypothetical protein